MYWNNSNKDNEIRRPGPGISFGDLLQITFIVLKLCNVITWSWFWVLTPLWVTIILLILVEWLKKK